MNDSKCISLINYVNLENIINFEYSENFPNSGFTSLIFPIRKALGPLPKIAEKIPASIGRGNKYVYKKSRSHDQDGRHAHIW